MDIQIEPNPNSPEDGHWVFNPVEESKAIDGIIMSSTKGDIECDVIGVNASGEWSQASATKINDSGEGLAYLIHGGDWGIRMRPKSFHHEDWDLNNAHQEGEAYKVYGRQEDILYSLKNQ